MTPPPITPSTLSTPELIEQWAEDFDAAGGGTIEEFAEYLLVNARGGDMERRYEGRISMGLQS